MGFKDVKQKVIECIERGAYDHEVRGNIDVKNLFQCGQLTDEYVVELIKATRGNEYDVSPHHQVPSVDVHVLKPFKDGKRWYVKFYFIEPDVMFISVHESEV
ncbi:MAG: hypothetical protein CENE_02280 [Candidatus Celerinatantimonas neptuna]|nr:MAG: hypothetical protein CENE_02280 [Candidatus Celerinatantimonas neptuna]